ncbi:complex I NDUFA9 subunit family protein [Rubrivivax gelatinosus]|uniref:NADH-ubiquinone oxidoreductase, putative n=1 Tax=Rubrivivax gelatinosus (strain NBRC 100245 / IL144) TaxID=983917 RepID=I0HLE8_RUBGI|nr:complex I NDUFA9 subunit family protein [Rubrivivax gelatinosus]BAL93835.1 NADH-ubiquinone oxidoreductase, putative [Rubrivivax gelatinosus IL144]
MKNVLVLGGTGFVGRSLVERLVERNGGGGGRVIVPTRRISHGTALRSLPTVELVEADVHDERTLARLVGQADAVINLIAVLHGSRAQFQRVHVELPRRLAHVCAAAGGRRVVHVSALGVGAGGPSNYLRSKTEGEAALQSPGVALTIVRPSLIFGTEDRVLNVFAELQAAAPFVPLPGGDAKMQPVWIEDVTTAIVRCLDDNTTIGQVYELAGPKVYTLSEIVRLAGRWSGHERRQIPLPDAVGRLQAMLMEAMPGTPLMSRDNLDSMRVPNVASGKLPGLHALGIEPTAMEAVAPGYLGGAFGRARYDRWRGHARRG